MASSQKKTLRHYFTPWKAGLCAAALGLAIATVYLLDLILPGNTTKAVVRNTADGTRFTIESMKFTILQLAFFMSFFAYPSLLFWLFWRQYSREYDRVRGPGDHSRQLTHAAKIAVYTPIGILLALAILLVVWCLVILPYTQIHRVTIDGKTIVVESLYRKWKVPQRELLEVTYRRRVTNSRRGGSAAQYWAEFKLRGGTVLRSTEINAHPPGGAEDLRFQQFFETLQRDLVEHP